MIPKELLFLLLSLSLLVMQFNHKPSFFSVSTSEWGGYWWKVYASPVLAHTALATQPCTCKMQWKSTNHWIYFFPLDGAQTCNPSIGISNPGPSLLVITSKLMVKRPWTKYWAISVLGHLINRAVNPNKATFTLWNFSDPVQPVFQYQLQLWVSLQVILHYSLWSPLQQPT